MKPGPEARKFGMEAPKKREQHSYEVRPHKDKRGVDLISDALPFGRLWYTKPDDAVEYAKFFSQPLEPISPGLLLPAVRTNKRLLAFVGAVINYE